MSKKRWDVLILSLICTIIGIGGGWYAALQSIGVSKTAVEDPALSKQALPEQTLKNLGVKLGKVRAKRFSRYRSLPAVVVDTAFTEQQVYAPLGGQIDKVKVEPGMVVSAGQTVATLIREPIPRPELMLTEEILKPATEEIHKTILELRKSRQKSKITREELERVIKFTGKVVQEEMPILPRKTEIDLRYQLESSLQDYKNAELGLMKHGFTQEEITSIAKGGVIPKRSKDSWQRALENNGLWSKSALELCNCLPPKQQSLPWTIATIGELAAAGLTTKELEKWLAQDKEAGKYFLAIGALLQKGHTVADLKRLHRLHAFSPIVQVIAPHSGKAEDWDVSRILVKPGKKVAAGAPLLTLVNPRRLYLKCNPVGGEVADLLRETAADTPCEAIPLIAKSGPVLKGLKVDYIASEEDSSGATAYLEIKNQVLTEKVNSRGTRSRTWSLRCGMKYSLRIQTGLLPNSFVLPCSAVTDDGPNKVIYIPDGDSFRPVPVEVAYEDHEVVVIPAGKGTALFPGDRIVIEGAFALGLALKSGSQAVQTGHGHSH